MHPKAQKYIDQKLKIAKLKEENQKNDFLISIGLCEKIYSPDNKKSIEYNYEEWDSNNQISRYYKIIPIEVSDEEFDEIKKAYEFAKLDNNENIYTSAIITALRVIAWIIFIVGVIVGFISGVLEIGLTCCAVSIISGATFLGIAEIISLLYDIKNKEWKLKLTVYAVSFLYWVMTQKIPVITNDNG